MINNLLDSSNIYNHRVARERDPTNRRATTLGGAERDPDVTWWR